MISPTNFGSQTRSAACLEVTGSFAPRRDAKSSTRMRHRWPWHITSNHHGWSHLGLPLQPFGLQIFRTAIVALLPAPGRSGGPSAITPALLYEILVGAPRPIQSSTSAG